MTDAGELRNVVEAALLVSENPMTPARILALFPEDARPTKEALHTTLEQLRQEYRGRGIELRKTGGAYRFWSCDRYAPWLRKLSETRAPRYSRALLETLAIIAYRQPVTRGDIEAIRGVTVSSDIMRVLLNRDWIKEIGKRDVPGHPAIYGTTPGFLAYFSLESLRDLPQLEEKRGLDAVAAEFNIDLPPPPPDTDGDGAGDDGDDLRPLIEEGAMTGPDWEAEVDDEVEADAEAEAEAEAVSAGAVSAGAVSAGAVTTEAEAVSAEAATETSRHGQGEDADAPQSAPPPDDSDGANDTDPGTDNGGDAAAGDAAAGEDE